MCTTDIDEAAEVIWGAARDLAAARVDGTSLNSERNVRYIVIVLMAHAKALAADLMLHKAIEKSFRQDEVIESLKGSNIQLQKQLNRAKAAVKRKAKRVNLHSTTKSKEVKKRETEDDTRKEIPTANALTLAEF